MRAFRLLGLLALLCILLPGASTAADAPVLKDEKLAGSSGNDKTGWPTHLRFLTGPNGGQWFMLGDPIAEVLSKAVIPTSSRMGGGVANISSINQKLGDVGFTLTCFMGAAESGEAEYQSIKMDNAILMTNVYPQVLYFLIRKDFAEKNGIDSVETLLQKKMPLRFAALKPGTASEFILSLLLKYGYNTSFDKLREQGWTISFNNYAETADNFVSGELDCFAYTAGTTVPLIQVMEEHTEVMILPLDQKVLDLLTAKFKTSTYIIQPGIYKSITKPVRTLGDYASFVVRKDLPDDLVFAINKALWEGRDSIAEVIKDFGLLSPETALPTGLPAHPGSVKFWNSIKKSK